MRSVERALQAAGCRKINLQVRSANASAVGFYRALGYSVEERVSLGKVLGEVKPGGPATGSAARGRSSAGYGT